MIGALLPLPPPVSLSSDDWAGAGGIKEARLSKLAEVDLRHENARWWRSLNRYMSVLGLLIIAAVVALVVVGVKQGWGQGPVR